MIEITDVLLTLLVVIEVYKLSKNARFLRKLKRIFFRK